MAVTADLLADLPGMTLAEKLGPGAVILRGFAQCNQQMLLSAIEQVAALAPFRNLLTPGGRRMSVAMTNCGELGWTSDQRGYRYCERDPTTQQHWPSMPESFCTLARCAAEQAGYPDFRPDACLVNRYQPGTRLTLHIDQDEQDVAAPIVSVSLGVAATFLWGGLNRRDRIQRVMLVSGDVVVWGGPSRFVYHGIGPLAEAHHRLTGSWRFNLTFRKAR